MLKRDPSVAALPQDDSAMGSERTKKSKIRTVRKTGDECRSRRTENSTGKCEVRAGVNGKFKIRTLREKREECGTRKCESKSLSRFTLSRRQRHDVGEIKS
jgi:hypothetical protein